MATMRLSCSSHRTKSEALFQVKVQLEPRLTLSRWIRRLDQSASQQHNAMLLSTNSPLTHQRGKSGNLEVSRARLTSSWEVGDQAPWLLTYRIPPRARLHFTRFHNRRSPGNLANFHLFRFADRHRLWVTTTLWSIMDSTPRVLNLSICSNPPSKTTGISTFEGLSATRTCSTSPGRRLSKFSQRSRNSLLVKRGTR